MRYCISDIHGEYDLFVKLLKKINFNDNDTLYVLGDIIDKGPNSYKLLKFLTQQKNIIILLGNHEYELLEFFENIHENFSKKEIINLINERFSLNCDNIIFDILDKLNNCPIFIELQDAILCHAGVPTNDNDEVCSDLLYYELAFFIYNRKFKEPDFVIKNSKCVIFGHTPTNYILNNKSTIIKYPRHLDYIDSNKVSDFYKIHIDCGTCLTGILGCICVDNMKCYYVNSQT